MISHKFVIVFKFEVIRFLRKMEEKIAVHKTLALCITY